MKLKEISEIIERLESQGEEVIILNNNKEITREELISEEILGYSLDLLHKPCLIIVTTK